jgi:hypothetical protein
MPCLNKAAKIVDLAGMERVNPFVLLNYSALFKGCRFSEFASSLRHDNAGGAAAIANIIV